MFGAALFELTAESAGGRPEEAGAP
jgi:hypothetical protein